MFWLEKDICDIFHNVENTLLKLILQNISENQLFQRIAKFILADSYEMCFMKGIFILVKVDEMYNILKSASHCLLVERWDGHGWSKFCLLEICPYVYYVPPLIRGRLRLVRDTAAEKEADITI